MRIITFIIILAIIGLFGIITKSVIGVIIGIVSLALSFLLFCTGALLTLVGKILAIVLSLAAIGAAIVLDPLALILIIPGICFAYSYVKKRMTNNYVVEKTNT